MGGRFGRRAAAEFAFRFGNAGPRAAPAPAQPLRPRLPLCSQRDVRMRYGTMTLPMALRPAPCPAPAAACLTDDESWAALAGPAQLPLPGTEVWMSWWWLRSWWEAYGARRQLRVLALHASPPLLCPLFCERRRGLRRLAFLGSDCRRHRLPHPGSDFAVCAQRWAELLAARRDWDVFDLRALPQAQAAAWIAALRALRLPLGPAHAWRQWYVALDRPWPQVEADFRPGLLSNLAKRDRALRRLGPLEFRLVEDAAGLAAVFDECLAIEASGWKGAGGTALACDPRGREFYRNVTRRAAAQGALWLALLYSGPTLIAFQLYLRSGDTLSGLRIGHRHDWRRHAPGMVLQRLVLERAHQLGFAEMDFSGGDEPFKSDWSASARTLVDVCAFHRTLRGCLAWRASQFRRRLKPPAAAVPPPPPPAAAAVPSPAGSPSRPPAASQSPQTARSPNTPSPATAG